MIVLFTDFGGRDPYVGQLKARLIEAAPGVAIVDLLHDVPDFNAHAGAHLLDALCREFPPGSVFLCVVDPGVGGPRGTLVMEADGRWYVGPDNGLLAVVAARAANARYWRIDWRPERLSASFYGRDLFAPMAAALAAGPFPEDHLATIAAPAVQFDAADLPRVLYLDHYGNAWTGLRGALLGENETLNVKGQALAKRAVFHEAGKGEPFWYVNSVGLVEIAVNRGSAAALLDLHVGDLVRVVRPSAGLH